MTDRIEIHSSRFGGTFFFTTGQTVFFFRASREKQKEITLQTLHPPALVFLHVPPILIIKLLTYLCTLESHLGGKGSVFPRGRRDGDGDGNGDGGDEDNNSDSGGGGGGGGGGGDSDSGRHRQQSTKRSDGNGE
jgi:uncharacterized membrane protein YgcG